MDDLRKLTLAWGAWANAPASPGRRQGRAKLYLLFLLIRFGGLRLSEAANMDFSRDLDLESGLCRVRGAYSRTLLLPLPCLRLLRPLLGAGEVTQASLAALDQGSIRRAFYKMADAAQISRGAAGPRALRYKRGCELLSLHTPLSLVQQYLGLIRAEQLESFLKFAASYNLAPALLSPATRNTFLCLITDINAGENSVLLKLKTFSGLNLAALTDMRSYVKMEPLIGMAARVYIPQDRVQLFVGQRKDAANCLPGKVVSFYSDSLEVFVTVDLEKAGVIYANLELSHLTSSILDNGTHVFACFPARAVQIQIP